MRRYLAAAAVFSCLCAFMGCRHIAGVCDCVGPCATCGCTPTGIGCGTPILGNQTGPPPLSQPMPAPAPERLRKMPNPADNQK